MKAKNIGVEVKKPKEDCKDRLCPFHGFTKLRGRTFVGDVISTKMQKTATVQFERRRDIPKYERYEKRKTRIKAHNPDCIGAKDGDIVKIMETKPISKTKNFVVIEKIGQVKGFKERMEALEEGKVKEEKKEEKAEEETEAKEEVKK